MEARIPTTADQSTVRRANLAVVWSQLLQGSISRADIAARTGLTRGTVGSLVGELEQRGLVEIGDVRRGRMGRPGNLVRVQRQRVRALGLGISEHYVHAAVVNLDGSVVSTRRKAIGPRFPSPEATIGEFVALGNGALSEAGHSGEAFVLGGISVAAPGLLDSDTGLVKRVPGTDWRDVDLHGPLARRLPHSVRGIGIHSAASLGAIAEYRLGASRAGNLIYLTGSDSLDAGFIVDGKPFRGAFGYAGEVGHMTTDPNGELCICGRQGCWQAMAGMNALLVAAADDGDPVRDSGIDIDQRMMTILMRARQNDTRTLDALNKIGRHLGIGISNLANAMNPKTIIVGGFIARLGEFLLDPIQQEMDRRIVADNRGGCELVASTLGAETAAIGGAIAALDPFVADPTLVPFAPAPAEIT